MMLEFATLPAGSLPSTLIVLGPSVSVAVTVVAVLFATLTSPVWFVPLTKILYWRLDEKIV